jgi:hypothetical protein
MLILLFPYKFNAHFSKKYQVEKLKKKLKGKFEIHDISNIISKKQVKNSIDQRYKSAIIFNKISHWDLYMKKKILNEKIYVINIIHENSFKSFYINYLLYKYKVKIIKITSQEVYIPKVRIYIFSRILKIFKLLLFTPSRFFFSLKNLLIKKLIFLLRYEELFITLSGSASKNYLMPIGNRAKKINFIDFHASDYSNYLLNKKKIKKKKNYVVFIDIKAPAFPGDDVILGNPIKYDLEKWYKDLNYFLINVEQIFNIKVIIIPHPSVRNLKNIYYDPKISVSHDIDATNKLVPNSKFVIVNGATTAVSYCIIYNKPVTLIYSDQVKKFNPDMFSETKSLAKILSTKIININKIIKKKNFSLKINSKRYDNYKFNYLTSKNIQKINNLDILKQIVSKP